MMHCEIDLSINDYKKDVSARIFTTAADRAVSARSLIAV